MAGKAWAGASESNSAALNMIVLNKVRLSRPLEAVIFLCRGLEHYMLGVYLPTVCWATKLRVSSGYQFLWRWPAPVPRLVMHNPYGGVINHGHRSFGIAEHD